MMLLPDFRVRQRDYLLEISRAMTAQLDVDEVLLRILKGAAEMLSAQVGLIALSDGQQATIFQPRAIFGVPPEALMLFTPLLEDILDETHTGLNFDTLDRKMRLVARQLDLSLRQVLALPMIIAGSVVGVIFVFRAYQAETTANDRQVLQSFADQAAIAVQNARLFETIRDEKQRLAAILEHSADGVMILDHGGTIQRFNRALARMSGWAAESAIGQAHDAVIRLSQATGESLTVALARGWPKLADNADNAAPIDLAGLAGDPETLYVEGDLLRPDRSRLSVGITYAPLLDENGTLRNVIAAVRDVTHFRQAEQAKSAFVSIVSHELKTPVTLIKGYAETLLRDDSHWDAATMRGSLHVIVEEADRLTELIGNLLTASRLQADGLQLSQVGEVDLGEVARRAVERFQTQADTHTITTDFPPDFPLIEGDEARLRQVIDNLLSNAVKYSPRGGEVAVYGTFDTDSVTVAVQDHGIGLPQDEQDRIFERFYRVDSTLTRTTQGTGLGLYLSRAIVEAHGGRMAVESAIGTGSTFSFQLPRRFDRPL